MKSRKLSVLLVPSAIIILTLTPTVLSVLAQSSYPTCTTVSPGNGMGVAEVEADRHDEPENAGEIK
jgi:hypothetical protein